MSSSAPARDRRLLQIVVVALVLVATAWFFLLGPGTRILSPKGSSIVELSGSGDQTTASFAARSGWQIQWTQSSDHFAISIQGDHNLGKVLDVTDTSLGVTTAPVGGTFHLEIDANGPWTARILQGD